MGDFDPPSNKGNKMIKYEFKYTGTSFNGSFEEYTGIITNLDLVEEKKNCPDYLHIYPHHSLEAYSKKELWEQVKMIVEDGIVFVNGKSFQFN